MRQELKLPEGCQHTDSQLLILQNVLNTKVSIYKISKFSIKRPELLGFFDQVGNYFCWFYIGRSPYTFDVIDHLLAKSLDMAMRFDGVLYLVQVRDNA